MNLDRLKYRYWQHTDWHDINSPLEAVYCNAVDGCDPTIAISDFEFCTGLKDKNGNLIYEGDIVKSMIRTGYIKWNKGDMTWFVYVMKSNEIIALNGYLDGELEIIGNIHEQAEQKE